MRQDNPIYKLSIKVSFSSKGQNNSKLKKQIYWILKSWAFDTIYLTVCLKMHLMSESELDTRLRNEL